MHTRDPITEEKRLQISSWERRESEQEQRPTLEQEENEEKLSFFKYRSRRDSLIQLSLKNRDDRSRSHDWNHRKREKKKVNN